MIAHIDFETRSAVDLKKSGQWVYAMHETTDALCAAYCFDNGPIKLWKLGEQLPSDLYNALIDPKVMFIAHNANFEFVILNYVCAKKYNWPNLPITRFDCTMIRAFSMGLPGTLENASKAVGLKAEKDMKGHRIMLQLSRPRGFDHNDKPAWWTYEDAKEKYDHLYRYCIQDVIVERELDKRLLKLSPKEKALWHLDQKINARGVKIDIRSAKRALKIIEKEKLRLDEKMRDITKNKVSTCNSSIQLKNWINEQGFKFENKNTTFDNEGIWDGDTLVIEGVAKDIINDLLDHEDLPLNIKLAIETRKEAAKNSTAKLLKMISGVNTDQRARGLIQFYGAASTGRFSGRRIQTQNMPRPKLKLSEIEDIFSQLLKKETHEEVRRHVSLFYGSVMNAVSDCLRGMIIADNGNKFLAADFSSIESRVLAWLAGEESTLNVYRSHGKIYEHTAMLIYNLNSIDEVTKEQRLIAKVATLALGYQGGVGAFQSMAKAYLIKIPDEQADDIKTKWRQKNTNTVRYWYALEGAAIEATKCPGQKFVVGPLGRQVCFIKNGSFLFCQLPSKRVITYPYPKIKAVKTPWGEMKNALTYKGEINRKFIRRVAYGGLIAENVTQATARDLLAESLFKVEEFGYNTVMHCHDEIVCEVKSGFGSPDQLEKILCELPDWAQGLPIGAEAWAGLRYRK